jgi:protein TonB
MSGLSAFSCDGTQGNNRFLGAPSLDSYMEDGRFLQIGRLSAIVSLSIHAAILIWITHTAIIPPTINFPPDSIDVEVVAIPPNDSTQNHPALEQIPPVRSSAPPAAEVRPLQKPAARILPPRKAELQKNEIQQQPAIGQVAALPATSNGAQDPDAPIPAPPKSTATESQPAANEEILRLYAEAVRTSILNHKPTGIRLRGIVGLTFSITKDGQLAAAEVSTSSGSETLDRAALSALLHAGPFPPFPGAATQQYLMFSIPFQFQ